MKIINKTRLIVIKDSKILVLENLGVPKKLTLAGGTTKKKETIEQSVIREVKEEINLNIHYSDLSYFCSLSKKTSTSILVKHFYVSKKVIYNFNVVELDKFKAVYWLDWSSAVKFMDKLDKKAITLYFKAVSHKLCKF